MSDGVAGTIEALARACPELFIHRCVHCHSIVEPQSMSWQPDFEWGPKPLYYCSIECAARYLEVAA